MTAFLRKAFLAVALCVVPFSVAEADIGNEKLDKDDFTDVAVVYDAIKTESEGMTFVRSLSLSIDFLAFHYFHQNREDIAASIQHNRVIF